MSTLRNTIAGSAAAIALTTGAAMAQENCGEVSITEMDWASATVVTAVASFLLQEGYGCEVTKIPSATNPAIASVAETGEPNILTELWVNASPVYDRLKEEGKVIPVGDVLTDAGEGWWIPAYLAEEHPELTTLEGILANPELVGNRFHQCPDGWACKTVNGNIAAGAGLEDAGIEIFQHGSGETMATSIAAAFEDEEPWLGYYWAPTSVLGKYPMVQVDLGEFDAEAHDCNSKEDCANPQVNPYPPATVLTVVTAEFSDANPDLADFLAKMSFPSELMNEMLAWQDANNASPDETAVYFLTTQKDMWSGWLNDRAKENLAALL